MRVADQLALLETRRAQMEELIDAHPAGPWMYSVTRSGLRALISPPPAAE
jgi:hypothetical protein